MVMLFAKRVKIPTHRKTMNESQYCGLSGNFHLTNKRFVLFHFSVSLILLPFDLETAS